MDAAPAWLTDWNRQRHVDKFAGQIWTRLIDDAALYEKYAGKDAIEGERDRKDITFPHPIIAEAAADAVLRRAAADAVRRRDHCWISRSRR